jgi:hypothetical protein
MQNPGVQLLSTHIYIYKANQMHSISPPILLNVTRQQHDIKLQ